MERNVLELDRLEDIVVLCLFFPTHRYVMATRGREEKACRDAGSKCIRQCLYHIVSNTSSGLPCRQKTLQMNCLQVALDDGSFHLHKQSERTQLV